MNQDGAAELLRESNRKEIEMQVEEFLSKGGSIDCLPKVNERGTSRQKTWKPAAVGSFESS